MVGIFSIIHKILAGGEPNEGVLYNIRVEPCDGPVKGVYRVIATTQSGPGQEPIDLRTLGCDEVDELIKVMIAIVAGAK